MGFAGSYIDRMGVERWKICNGSLAYKGKEPSGFRRGWALVETKTVLIVL